MLKAHTDHSPEVIWIQLLYMPTLYGILLGVVDVALMGKNLKSYWLMGNTASSALFISSAEQPKTQCANADTSLLFGDVLSYQH